MYYTRTKTKSDHRSVKNSTTRATTSDSVQENDDELGQKCTICNATTHDSKKCPLILGGKKISDATVPKRAFATIPSGLEIREAPKGNYDVVCSKRFPSGVQFGPFIAPKVSSFNPSCAYTLKIFKGPETLCLLDTTDLNKCNWMALVRFTKEYDSCNTICYQLKKEIYFSTIADIKCGESLILAYSPGYLSMLDASSSISLRQTTPTAAIIEDNKIEAADNEKMEDVIATDHDYFDYSAEMLSKSQDDEDHDSQDKKTMSSNSEPSTSKAEKKIKSPSRNKIKRRRTFIVESVTHWKCKYCNESMEYLQSFADHLIKHFQQWNNDDLELIFPTACDICSSKKKVYTATEIISHLKLHSSQQYMSLHKTKTPIKFNDGLNESNSHGKVQCPFCPLESCSKLSMQKHALNCHTCTTKNGLKDQECSNERISINSCAICCRKFAKMNNLEIHLKIHDASLFICKNCNRIQTNETLRSHMQICNRIHEIENQSADLLKDCVWNDCDKTFKDLDSFKLHVVLHSHPFSCCVCGIRFRASEEIGIHSCKKLNCDADDCQFVGNCLQDLQKHIDTDHSETKNYCIDCAFPFATKNGFKNHADYPAEHASSAVSPAIGSKTKRKSGRDFMCETCGAIYSNWNTMKTHRLTHNPRHSCPTCNKTFSRKDLLNDHLSVHSSEAQFTCDVCGSKIKTKKSLMVHQRIHEDFKRFHCTICGKTFTQKGNFLVHKRVHDSNRKTFKCSFEDCDKSFSSEAYMKVHRDSHENSNVEIFPCDICPRKFLRRQQLRKHKRAAHSNDRYRCEFCVPVLHMKHRQSLVRHFITRHPTEEAVWGVNGYVEKMFVPGDGNYSYPSLRKSSTIKNQRKTPHAISVHYEEGDFAEKAEDNAAMIPMPGDCEVGIEVVVGDDNNFTMTRIDGNPSPNKHPENHEQELMEVDNNMEMVLLQLEGDDTGRFVIAFSNQLQ